MRRPNLSPSERDEQRAFLRSIQETPEDDAPRLVYADWLDDHGDPHRADFVRTQCRLERMPRNDPQRHALRTREADLLRRHKSEWLGPWDSRSNDAAFRRGFLDAFRVGANFALGMSTVAAALSPYHDLTRSFAFHSNRLAGSLAPLLGGALPCLERLECENCIHGNALAEAIAAWPSSGLTELVLRGCEIGAPGVTALSRAPWLASLRYLDLRNNRVGRDALTSLLLRPELGGLEGLAVMGGPDLTGSVLAPLLAKNLAGLRRLRVQNPLTFAWSMNERGGINDDGLRLLAGSPALARFTALEFISQMIQDDGVGALARSPHVRGLTTLNLRGSRLTDAGITALAGSPNLANLTCLDLSATQGWGAQSTVSVRRLAESRHLRNLVTLRLTSTMRQPDAIVEPLLEAGHLPSLRDLVLNVRDSSALVERFRARGVELTTSYDGD